MTEGEKRFMTVFSAIPICGLAVLVLDICFYDDPVIGEDAREMMPMHALLQTSSLIFFYIALTYL